MTIDDMAKLSDIAKDLGYNVIKLLYSNYLICFPNTPYYSAVIDYTYLEEDIFDYIDDIFVFKNINDPLSFTSKHILENIKNHSLEEMTELLKKLQKDYKNLKIQQKLEEINKDF